jgi:uncharacterized membrane protein
VFDQLLHDHPHVAAALFFGIIAAAVVIVLIYRKVERS